MSYLGNQVVSGAIQVEYFSGTGAQTSFPLSYAMGTESSLLVTISGVKQQAASYTILNGALTFSTAPASGTNNIEVVYLGGGILMTGVNQFGDGTQALPSISHLGNSNTGMWFPDDNVVAVSTGGTERLRVGANGQIGLSGENYGTTGQVLTSNASNAAVWSTIASISLADGSVTTAKLADSSVTTAKLADSSATPAKGGTGQNFSTTAQGSTLYFSGTGTVAALAPGTSGQFLKTQGTGANPTWTDVTTTMTGEIRMWSTTSIPSGWLECDGAAISRSTYSALFTVIGTTFGSGDGSTTFNVPDFRSRSPLGKGAGSGLSSWTLGDKYGAETHTLTKSQLPTHAHKHGAPWYGSGFSTTTPPNSWPWRLLPHPDDGSGGNPETTSVGDGSSHNNMHPIIAIVFIIKT